MAETTVTTISTGDDFARPVSFGSLTNPGAFAARFPRNGTAGAGARTGTTVPPVTVSA